MSHPTHKNCTSPQLGIHTNRRDLHNRLNSSSSMIFSAAAADISEADWIFPACSSLIRMTPLWQTSRVVSVQLYKQEVNTTTGRLTTDEIKYRACPRSMHQMRNIFAFETMDRSI